jgi:superfamily I DNA/RNA helicase
MNYELSVEQKDAINQPFTGAYSIKGIAGSGKTTVGIHRFNHLLKRTSGEGNKILFVTYQKTLISYLEHLIEKEQINNPLIWDVSQNYDVKSIDSLIHSVFVNAEIAIKYNLQNNRVVKDSERDGVFERALTITREFYPEVNILKQNNFRFLRNEVDYINSCNIYSLFDYQVFDRLGQGKATNSIRLPKKSKTREAIYFLKKKYNKLMIDEGKIDWPIKRMIAFLHIKNNPVAEYTHMIIDESQDLSKVQLDFLKYFLDHSRNNSGATFLYDTTQSIYLSSWLGRRQSFKSLGVNIKGKTLNKNFRTTAEIQQAAQALLKTDSYFNKEYKPEIINKTGIKPVYARFVNEETQAEYIIDVIKSLSADFNLNDIIVCSRTNNDLFNLKEKFNLAGINADITGKNKASFGKDQIRLMTLHSVKGIESDVVIIANVNEGKLPLENKKLEEEKQAERNLMYVGMTRAIKYLYITSSGKPSPFIIDIGNKHLNVFNINEWQKHKVIENPETKSKIIDFDKALQEILKFLDELKPIKRSNSDFYKYINNLMGKRIELDRLSMALNDLSDQITEGSNTFNLLQQLQKKANDQIFKLEKRISSPDRSLTDFYYEFEKRFNKFSKISINAIASAKFEIDIIEEKYQDSFDWSGVIINIAQCVEKELKRILREKHKIKPNKYLAPNVELASNLTNETKGLASELNNLEKLSNKQKKRKKVIQFSDIRNDAAHPNKNINFETLVLVENRMFKENDILDKMNSIL